jgi:hypothetical protein
MISASSLKDWYSHNESNNALVSSVLPLLKAIVAASFAVECIVFPARTSSDCKRLIHDIVHPHRLLVE